MFVADGPSLTAVPVMGLLPTIADATLSVTLVRMLKFALKLVAGVNVTRPRRTLTSAMGPDAVHTPALNDDVAPPLVAGLAASVPAGGFESVRVTVTFALSTSLTTMSIRLSAVSSVYVSGALRFVAVGASLTFVTTTDAVSVAVEKAVAPPFVVVSASVSLAPAETPHARNVIAFANVPLTFVPAFT